MTQISRNFFFLKKGQISQKNREIHARANPRGQATWEISPIQESGVCDIRAPFAPKILEHKLIRVVWRNSSESGVKSLFSNSEILHKIIFLWLSFVTLVGATELLFEPVGCRCLCSYRACLSANGQRQGPAASAQYMPHGQSTVIGLSR